MLAQKWLFVGILVLLSFSLAMAAPPAVHPTTGEPLVITCLRGTPEAIDGDLSDWNLDAMTPAVLDAQGQVYTGQASWTAPADCSGKFYLLWDDAKIYIAVVAKDDKLAMNKSSGDIWNADCVEVFFSTTNAVAPHAEHYQYGFNANNQKWNWCNIDGAGSIDPAYLQVASARTADGYVCEVSIEYAQMPSLDFVAGNTIGLHPGLDDTDSADREVQITWTGREAHDQSLGFGYLNLSSDPAIAKELSRGPNPTHGAVDVPADAILSWSPGQFAAGHDVYFGTAFEDVSGATRNNSMGVLVSQGQAAVQYDPDGLLEFGRTYYWRVDEVNAAPDNTIFKGTVWSFTAEPFAYPIKNLTVKASSKSSVGTGPERTIDGSGLDPDDLHSAELTDMWMSNGTLPNWIQYEFDRVYKLDDLWVWNSNYSMEPFVGFGAKEVTVEYSTDGATWTALEDVPEFVRAPGLPAHPADTIVHFGGVTAKYVKLTIEKAWGGRNQTGLSEVRFHYVPLQAYQPTPADGATDIGLDTELTWRSGREASSHEVFLGTDSAAVAAGTVAGKTVTERSHTPAAMTFGTTYYWKVNEIGETGTSEGDLWSFTAREFAAIDDFESYTDDEGSRVFDFWLDGYTDESNGSVVGYLDAAGGTFGETSIIHGGRQSMPLAYDNSGPAFYSEVVREFETAQNWAGSGATELCVWTRGYPAPTSVTVTETGGKMSLAGSGADIWGASDQFTYAYKTLRGDGSMTARVTNIGAGTNTWAKGGVMIRDSLDGGSASAQMVLTANTDGAAGNGAAFQNRATTGLDMNANDASSNTTSAAVIAAPYWVKIERTGDTLNGFLSPDGKNWTPLGSANVTLADPVYIGLCVTSHAAGESRTFQFESISTTGNVTGTWQGAVIDAPRYNGAADMHLTVQDSTGKTATATSATAVTAADWTPWKIPMSSLSAVSFSKVKKLTIGIGTKGGTTADGSGIVFIDDIGYGRSAQ